VQLITSISVIQSCVCGLGRRSQGYKLFATPSNSRNSRQSQECRPLSRLPEWHCIVQHMHEVLCISL